ncbi:MAG TPA: hypothetical protein VGX16_00665 [Solirubrobacteraceae bacterium]|jgi:hypothetical protein|nr:hypothetical protein [Solirubrobacteraceae bacterium]
MRTDPSDTGGLFVGRRPGTAPIRFRALPKRGSKRRRRIDGALAGAILAAMTLLCLLCWGPFPVAGLWVGSEITYLTGSVSLGILSALLAVGLLLFGSLTLTRRLDDAWILVRRAAGHDQRTGVLGRVFALTALLCGGAFLFWFLIIHGPGYGLITRGG